MTTPTIAQFGKKAAAIYVKTLH